MILGDIAGVPMATRWDQFDTGVSHCTYVHTDTHVCCNQTGRIQYMVGTEGTEGTVVSLEGNSDRMAGSVGDTGAVRAM